MKIETWIVPVISTCHMDEKTATAIREDGDNNEWSIPVANYGHGCIFLGCDQMAPREDWPECVKRIYAWARQHGFNMVRLDCDASPIEFLYRFEW